MEDLGVNWPRSFCFEKQKAHKAVRVTFRTARNFHILFCHHFHIFSGGSYLFRSLGDEN
jgi:hypothetical protein